MSHTAQDTRSRTDPSPPWSADLVGVGAAVVCAMVTWFCTVHLAELDLAVRRGGEVQQVGATSIAVTAGASALLGILVLRLLERRTSAALRIWTTLAAVVTLVSLLGPLSATSGAAIGVLASMHTVVAAVVVASASSSRRRRKTAG
jgi:heme A synthase